MKPHILLHRVTVVGFSEHSTAQFRSEELPDVYFLDQLAGLVRNFSHGFDAVLISGVKPILVKEPIKVVLEMIEAAGTD